MGIEFTPSKGHLVIETAGTARDTRRKPGSVAKNPLYWTMAVAVVYTIVQFAVLDLRTFFGWDESVYLTEVSPYLDSINLAAHRSRGITLIIAPVALITDSVPVIRAYLIAISGVSLFATFAVWVRLVDWAAPVGASIFATSWMALFFAGQITPNIWSAFFGIAAIGMALSYLLARATRSLWVYAGLVAAVAFIRPLDGLTLIAGLSLVAVVVRKGVRDSLVFVLASGSGFMAGVLPWIIEAFFRFGDPLQRLDRARELVGGGLTNNFTEYLNLLDGALVWTGTPDGVRVSAVLWLATLGILSVVAISSRRYRPLSWCLLLVSAFLALPYAIGADVAAPRFMLPALATLCLAAGMGIASLRSTKWRVAVLIGLLTLGVAWNLPVYHGFADFHLRSGERVKLLGEALRSHSEGEECFFLSPGGNSQISVASGCDGFRLLGDPLQDDERFDAAAAEGRAVLALVPTGMLDQFAGITWSCEPVEGLEPTDWQICERSG